MKTNASLFLSILALMGVLGWSHVISRTRMEPAYQPPHANTNLSGAAYSGARFIMDIPSMVRSSPVIIKGRITAIGTQTWYEPPPTPGPTPTFDPWLPSGIRTGSYHTFYSFRVLEVYKDDGDLEMGDIIQVGVVTAPPDPFGGQSLGSVNDEYLSFLIKASPESHYYTVYGHFGIGRLSLTSAPVRYENGTPYPFATALSVAAFLEELQDEVSRQGTATITPHPSPTIDPGDTEDPTNN